VKNYFIYTIFKVIYSQIHYLYNKRVCSTKNEPQQQGISFWEREREGYGYERERGRHIKVRFERVREVEGEAEIQRDRET